MRLIIFLFGCILFYSFASAQRTIKVTFSSCPSGEFTYVENGTVDGKTLYEVSPPTAYPNLSVIYWVGAEWHIAIKTTADNGLVFRNSLDTPEPPCLDEGNWELFDWDTDCSGNETILSMVSSDGRCGTPIPTLSQWGLIILGLCLSILGVVVIRQYYIVLSSRF